MADRKQSPMPSAAVGSMPSAARVDAATARRNAALPKRRLGRTNQDVSVVGMGGFHIGTSDLADADAVRLVHAAVDRGITFMDNCWDYNLGASEVRMGEALRTGGYRDRVFLMTKIDGRTFDAAAEQIDQSLARLHTDRIDLLQFHENIRRSDADRIFAAGGAFEAAIAAREAGKIRFIGFTGHKHPDYHLHMIEVARAHEFTFDTVQMPLNVMDAHYESFEQKVLPVANGLDMGVIAMKTFGDPYILDAGLVAPVDMLHYGMNLPVSVVVTGIDSFEILDQAVDAAASFAPMTDATVASLLAKTAALAATGKTERYKTSQLFDATIENPHWLETAVL
ncbi:MAG: aldo/keto reductase [Vulcanimicrobiaceae bacterium]